MSTKLTKNLNAVQEAPIEIKYLNGDLNIIQKLDDEPNDVGGLTSAQLKAKFDEAGNAIKDYINNDLIPAIIEDDATEKARAAAEAARESAETERETAETARQQAEAARVQAEAARAAAETARAQAEEARETAEEARADETSGIVARATAQAQRAEDEAGIAANQSGIAQTAAKNAASAASAAMNAAGDAGEQAEDAENAAKEAAGYAGNANATRLNAENAAARAEAAAKEAEQAGQPSDAAPKAPGTAAAGTATTYARGDHVHPKELPDGGETGQVLKKAASGCEWGEAPAGVEIFTNILVTQANAATYDNVVAALDAGKLPVVRYNKSIYIPYSINGNTVYLTALGFKGVSGDLSLTKNAGMGIVTGGVVQGHITAKGLLKGSGSTTDQIRNISAAVAGTDYAEPPVLRKVTLTVEDWDSSTKQQSVIVTGVLADVTKQNISPAPADASYASAWNSCGVLCVAQEANGLTFQCSKIPEAAIEVYVIIESAKYTT